MKVRILTRDNIDEVIENVKSITIVENVVIVRADLTFNYDLTDILFYQCY